MSKCRNLCNMETGHAILFFLITIRPEGLTTEDETTHTILKKMGILFVTMSESPFFFLQAILKQWDSDMVILKEWGHGHDGNREVFCFFSLYNFFRYASLH